jgi:hypothetical protein
VILFPTFLGADIRWGFDAIWNVSLIANSQINNSQIEFTLDGGVTWLALNNSGPIRALDERIFNIKAGDKDLFNLRCTNAQGCDIYRVLVSIAPQDIQRPVADIDVNVPIPLPVDICPVNCPIDVNILNQPITVTQSANPLPVSFTQPISVDVVSFLPNPLPVDICPVTCDLPVINGSVTPLIVSFTPPVGTPNGVIILSKTNSAELANTDISGVDLSPSGTSPGDAVIFRIEWSASVVGVLSATLDSTNFVVFNNGSNLRAESLHLFDMVVEHGDLWNLQFNKPTTVRFLRVIQVI